MNAGKLRSKIILQVPAAGEDAAGQPVFGWVDSATVWADVRYVSGLTAIKAEAPVMMRNVSIRIRKRSVSASMRVVHGLVKFSIEAVLPDAKGEFIDLVCQAVE